MHIIVSIAQIKKWQSKIIYYLPLYIIHIRMKFLCYSNNNLVSFYTLVLSVLVIINSLQMCFSENLLIIKLFLISNDDVSQKKFILCSLISKLLPLIKKKSNVDGYMNTYTYAVVTICCLSYHILAV